MRRCHMLKLKDIAKNYYLGETIVEALKGITLEFRKSEFVSILGPSGCGKTTLLNIIGGLDRYTSGDLFIRNRSTKDYKDQDWDAYRNHSIGFVFQSYNLIPHLNVLENVELALTISGTNAAERKRRAIDALTKVGLADQLSKRPNQLSGGQMQRVAIARALVNDPEILLADEPTGAIDSKTSVQIMELLKEIARDRLVIMVTHNDILASQYSTRIIKLLDGQVIEDSNPYHEEELIEKRGPSKLKTSMTFRTALLLSFKNLLTKKTRTLLTAFAGSIGIIGIALVLALSNGFKIYINDMQAKTLSGYPLTISNSTATGSGIMDYFKPKKGEFPTEEKIYRYQREGIHYNNFTHEYLEYLENMDQDLYHSIKYYRSLNLNLIKRQADNTYITRSANWSEMIDSTFLIEKQYDILKGKLPENKNELVLVVNTFNQISSRTLESVGISYSGNQSFDFDDFIGLELRAILNNEYYYKKSEGFGVNQNLEELYHNERAIPLKIVGILRIKSSKEIGVLSEGINFTKELTEYILNDASTSEVVLAQKGNYTTNVINGKPFPDGEEGKRLYNQIIAAINGNAIPYNISIYPVDFESKEAIKEYLDQYNDIQEDANNRIIYNDYAEMASSIMGQVVDSISYVLIAFTAVSLVVSSIMIGIITYISVIERTKEIGILRSIGARKIDISRVFNAETAIIGFTAGLIGVVSAYVLSIPINSLLRRFVAQLDANVAKLNIIHGLILIVISILLTLISGLIPSRIASKKDPVIALRTE